MWSNRSCQKFKSSQLKWWTYRKIPCTKKHSWHSTVADHRSVSTSRHILYGLLLLLGVLHTRDSTITHMTWFSTSQFWSAQHQAGNIFNQTIDSAETTMLRIRNPSLFQVLKSISYLICPASNGLIAYNQSCNSLSLRVCIMNDLCFVDILKWRKQEINPGLLPRTSC